MSFTLAQLKTAIQDYKAKSMVTVTDDAWYKMKEILKNSDSKGFLYYVTSGGCNGFNFNLKLFDKSDPQCISVIKYGNISLHIHPMSEMQLLGSTIDHIKEDYAEGQFENKFIFKAGGDSTSCGCGISFS